MVRKVLDQKILSIPEVKQILEAIPNGEESFDSFQDGTLKYARLFSKLDVEKVTAIKKMLMKDYALDEDYAIMVINIFPTYVEELRVIFEKDLKASKLSDKELEDIVKKIHELSN